MNVLFLCTGNSCRSILAEATFNHLAPAGWRAMSAGSQPTGQVHPRSLALLVREGIATEGYFSKSWERLPVAPDIVITVCSSAAGEACPAYLGPMLRSHWGVDDPAYATGTDQEVDAAFMKAYRILRARIESFLALPIDELQRDRSRFKVELDRIGALSRLLTRLPMKKIQVFDPALCCNSGVCGSEVDQALVTFAADVNWATQNGSSIERFNLAQQPMAFAENTTVKGFLERAGQEALPLTLVDGEVALAGRYPTRADLVRWSEMTASAGAQPKGNSCCSGGRCC